ncbi:uncharacterized protein F5147DRAFT_689318 [Suillus discolor]|uniref:DUF6533 domain-containing protein n=1 Tax=Suillus discolor TaxID=1912936 RepID=A0A9P7FAM6_9AGAM|nr:uncharacterized protein F5147DRAFT_689318 [Suillus discolor]KAG2110612.1 hypothetical protein F5147DRAFT_689318 [Suillus discolor]
MVARTNVAYITASDALLSTSFPVVLSCIVIDSSQVQQMPIRFKLYTILVANSILIYDHMATITDEITFIWCRPKALSAILFLINRYVALLGNVFMLSMYLLPISHEVLWFRYARTQLAGSHLISAEVSTLVLQCVIFLNKDLAVGHILHRKIYSFFSNKYSFVLY